MQRVQKLIANAGYCSRRQAEQLIADGRVQVNGEIITLGDQAESLSEVTIDNKSVTQDTALTIAYYKPKGVQTSLKDEHTETLAPLLRKLGQRLIPAGRLDMDAEGLLILTNDGDLAHHIMHPSNEKTKTYSARMDCSVTEKHISELKKGITLQDGPVQVHEAEKLNDHMIRLTIHEGRNKIVKRTLRKVTNGFVEQLVREQIGSIKLGSLKPGEYRKLSEQEILELKK